MSKYEEPVLTSTDIRKQCDDLVYFSTPIFNKPKPKPMAFDTPVPEATPASNLSKESEDQPIPETPEAKADVNDTDVDHK
jgi:heat shock protein 4